MAEYVTCPTCGSKVLTADPLIGRQVRCIGCGSRFTAAADPPQSERTIESRAKPVLDYEDERAPAPPRYDRDDEDDEDRPFCPGCGRRVSWSDDACPQCGEEFEDEDRPPSLKLGANVKMPVRRDGEPHRGRLLFTLSALSCFCGVLAACSFGIGAAISVPLGVLVLALASRDLRRMENGSVDPRGRQLTNTASSTAIAGVIFGVLFAGVYILIWLAR
jgi:hypothetical protein